MSAPFFILGGILIVWFFVLHFKPEPPEDKTRRRTFEAPLRRGKIAADLYYQAPDFDSVEPVIHHWAIRLENPEVPLDEILEAELNRHGIQTKVVSVAILGADSPPEKPSKPSTAESLIRDFKAKGEAAEALAKEASIDLDDIEGASLKVHQERYVKGKIKHLFYHDDRA